MISYENVGQWDTANDCLCASVCLCVKSCSLYCYGFFFVVWFCWYVSIYYLSSSCYFSAIMRCGTVESKPKIFA